jgi:hypothetical protein
MKIHMIKSDNELSSRKYSFQMQNELIGGSTCANYCSLIIVDVTEEIGVTQYRY